MLKKTYWKDIRHSFSQSKGRFFSIFSLMMIGAIALVGLKVTSPNMEKTGQAFVENHKLADLMVMGSHGLNDDDVAELKSISDSQVEFGYLADVTVADSHRAVRIFSQTRNLSTYDVVEGQYPNKSTEIALSDSLSEDYNIGDRISFDQGDRGQLKTKTFTVTGFVNASDIWDKANFGSSSVGYGQLTGYAITTQQAFDRSVYGWARIRYNDLAELPYYSDDYTEKSHQAEDEVTEILSDNGAAYLSILTKEPKEKLSKAQEQLADKEKEVQSLPAGPQKIAAQEKVNQIKEDLENQQAKLENILEPTYGVYTRASMPGSDGYTTYLNSTSSISAVGNIFPVVLYLVAAMVTSTTMTRFVDEERSKAGIFKALGYTNRDIIRKFVLYGLVASLAGTMVGILLGNLVMSPMIGNIISGNSVVGASQLHFYPLWNFLALGLALLSAVLPTYWVARRELTEQTAQLLQAKPPVVGSKILLERIRFIWKHLSFTHKVTARNIFRYKQRMLMTILGVAGSVALLYAGLGIQSSISGIISTQFEDLIHYDMIVVENSRAEEQDKRQVTSLLDKADLMHNQAIQLLTAEEDITGITDKQVISVFVTEGDLSDLVTLRQRKGDDLRLDDSGAIFSEKLASLYKVKVGDLVEMTISDQKVPVRVAGISELYAGHQLYMTNVYYESITNQAYLPNARLVAINQVTDQKIKDLAADLMAEEGIETVVQNTSLINQVAKISSSLNSVMLILIVLSVLLALVILYNLTNINVAERLRELSTIKVLGFHNKEVTLYIYRETIVLSLIGIVAGLIMGKMIHRLILDLIGSSTIMFNPAVAWHVYVIPILSIMAILTGLGLMVNRKLRDVDMLEALKSVE